MVLFAAREFGLEGKVEGDDKSTIRQHLEGLWRRALRRDPDAPPPKGLDFEPCPEEVKYLWTWFQELNKGRTGNGFGVNPLTWLEIEAWARMHGVQLTRAELAALKDLDAEFMTFANKQQSDTKEAPTSTGEAPRSDEAQEA